MDDRNALSPTNKDVKEGVIIGEPRVSTVSVTGQALRGSRSALLSALSFTPLPLRLPAVTPDFDRLSRFEQVLEATRYSIVSFEYTFNPNGWARAWLLLFLRLLFLINVPILILGLTVWALVPVIFGGAKFAEGFALMSGGLAQAFGSLFIAAAYALGTVIIFAAICAVLAAFVRAKK